jgi:hypothetical protein
MEGYRDTITIDPYDADAHNEMGRILSSSGRK